MKAHLCLTGNREINTERFGECSSREGGIRACSSTILDSFQASEVEVISLGRVMQKQSHGLQELRQRT